MKLSSVSESVKTNGAAAVPSAPVEPALQIGVSSGDVNSVKPKDETAASSGPVKPVVLTGVSSGDVNRCLFRELIWYKKGLVKWLEEEGGFSNSLSGGNFITNHWMTVEDSRKLLPAEIYPSWVVFSERQKLTWLNHHLTKIWPYVDEAASELIRASVELILEQYRSAVVASLTFSKLTLGTVAPQFTGVSIVEDDENGMTMELDMNWDGNPNIVLGIKTLETIEEVQRLAYVTFGGWFDNMSSIRREEETETMAAEIEVVDRPNDEGEMFTRPVKLSDRLPQPYSNESAARFANG
ncbi:uncharacterized protein LOC108834719 isoform X3 [Raphanus sativus]|uniref:Uncharacterized protein LOC108834719 isoform X3 n=1 Tax=Raphanus sativus TaxID=3726 RepID=A0A9W3C404_RAPSA|nr:uncharacterized protein LOC108834719 isoform X3 [Raphanus sativus]